jgi:hypothetical protein
MKVTFADSFWESLKTLSRQQTWWYKTYELFRYKIPQFCKNLWYFRKELWEFRSFDYSYNLKLFAKSLEQTADTLEHGIEEDETRLKKVSKIRRAVELIHFHCDESYLQKAEEELGKMYLSDWLSEEPETELTEEQRAHNKKVSLRSMELEKELWNELFFILKGQDYREFEILQKLRSVKERDNYDHYREWFDGSGLKGWWD